MDIYLEYAEIANKRDALIEKNASKPGFKGKVAAKCIECIYDPTQPGTWRNQVQNCTDNGCPLYSVRPLSSAEPH